MRQIKRDNWGGYYVMLTEDKRKIFGVRPLHCYSCGYVGDYELLYIFWDIGEMPDTQGENQESFDFAAIDGDAIMASPLVQAAIGGVDVGTPTEDMLSCFCASSAQTVWNDLLSGMSLFDILFLRLGIMVDQYVGESWEEVMYENPDWLVESIKTDEEGNEYKVSNIKEFIGR